jgi:XTP/dITP diphosphohydrolase
MPAAATILVATANLHKAAEIRSILGAGFRVGSMRDVPEPPRLLEEADTFEGNALAKATQLAAHLQHRPGSFQIEAPEDRLWVLADDSGLEVDVLGGAPGVHSARYARLGTGERGNASDAENNAKLLRVMAKVPEGQRSARFRCVLAILLVEARTGKQVGEPSMFEGTCEGWIGFEPRGQGGFGYDPLFRPEGREETFAELGEETKNGLSHRYRALLKMREWLGLRSGGGIQ